MESDFEVLVLISTNFKLSWKPPKCKLEVIAWWNEQNHIVCKKQRGYSETTSNSGLHLEIVFIEAMKRVSDKEQPWSPQWCGELNESLFLLM